MKAAGVFKVCELNSADLIIRAKLPDSLELPLAEKWLSFPFLEKAIPLCDETFCFEEYIHRQCDLASFYGEKTLYSHEFKDNSDCGLLTLTVVSPATDNS